MGIFGKVSQRNFAEVYFSDSLFKLIRIFQYTLAMWGLQNLKHMINLSMKKAAI